MPEVRILVNGTATWSHMIEGNAVVSAYLDDQEIEVVPVERAQLLDKAMQSDVEHPVNMTFGELLLFHVLLQDYGIQLVGDDRFIPLMIRNKARIDSVKKV